MKLALGRHEDAVRSQVERLRVERAAERVWARDAGFWGGEAERQASVMNRLGWLDVASRMREALPELARFAEQVRDEGYRDLVLLGMGGSSLAPEVLRASFGRQQGWPALHVLDSTDPATILTIARSTDAARTLFFVSSKSGTTLESNALFNYFHEAVRGAKGERAGENFVAITDAGTPLQDLAREHGFRQVFTNSGDIGGRYSALSYFGLAPAAAAGIDVGTLLKRGVAAAEESRKAESDALRLGAALGALALQGCDKATFVVSPAVASFGLWVEQLIAESTGKLGRGILPVVGEPVGAPDRYGEDRQFVRIGLAGEPAGAEIPAQPVTTLELGDVLDLGGAFFRWEYAVAIAGEVLGINPFDEPNVQESKDNTARVLREFVASGKLDADGIDSARGVVALTRPNAVAEKPLREAVADLVSSVHDGDYFAITAYVQQTPESDEAFRAMRAAVRDARGVATTLGYGPRFLHSTGQLHKGGPPRGVFLQVTQSDAEDVRIPGMGYTFGQCKRAQAIGDFESLAGRGRPALRAHIAGDLAAGLTKVREAVELATR